MMIKQQKPCAEFRLVKTLMSYGEHCRCHTVDCRCHTVSTVNVIILSYTFLLTIYY